MFCRLTGRYLSLRIHKEGFLRLHSFSVQKSGPVDHVSVEELANVVVLAGPNGVGKTSILNALLQLARSPASQVSPDANIWMKVEA